jgi:glycerol-3-phosphate responsive antiterminator
MTAEPRRVHLPQVLVADGGRRPLALPPLSDVGILYRDIELPTLLAAASGDPRPKAVDLDTVPGLAGDDHAVDFVMNRLGIRIVLSRRPQTVEQVAQLGGLALLHVLAFDSTGVARSLEGHPRITGVGCVISPGAVLPHMLPSEVARLPRPVLAYGFIVEPDDANRCLALADGIVVRLDVAQAMAESRAEPTPERQTPKRLLTRTSPGE